ncbi:MAG: hypothetical protein ACUVXI_18215 [bacterium]
MSYIEGESIGEAYFKALDAIINDKMPHWYMTIHISQPILGTSTSGSISSLDISKLLNVINVGNEVYDAFIKFKFSKPGRWTNGCFGIDWINGRIKDLLDDQGYYKKSLSNGFSFDQLQEVEKRLSCRSKKGSKLHGGATNALVCSVFLPDEDLKAACKPRPRAGGIRCLTQIDFKPRKDKLNLMAVFRSQFFDTKAYGNFVALAILLYKMCQNTGYEPGAIVSTANNVTFDGHEKSLYKYLCASIGGGI